jgi:rubrerythrin
MSTKDVRELIRVVEAQPDCTTVRSKRGHVQFIKNGKMIAHTGLTPSDVRSLLNVKADLKRNGVAVTKSELRKRQREAKQAEQAEQKETSQVDRQNQPQPEREKWYCEVCGDCVGWVTDYKMHAQHMTGVHGKRACPCCGEWLDARGLLNHIRFGHPSETWPDDMPIDLLERLTAPPKTGKNAAKGVAFAEIDPTPPKAPAPKSDISLPASPAGGNPGDAGGHPAGSENSSDEHAVDNPFKDMDKWTVRQGKKPATGKRFHLFKNCGQMDPEHELNDVRHVRLTDEMVDLFGLKACAFCARRALRTSVEQSIAKGLASHKPCTPESLVAQLRADGYVIVEA